eukprot:8448450-Alexandrium_andersonii.AAC.1
MGLFLAYDSHRGLVLPDLELFARDGKRSIVQSRDIRVAPGPPFFPLRLLSDRLGPVFAWKFELPCELFDE